MRRPSFFPLLVLALTLTLVTMFIFVVSPTSIVQKKIVTQDRTITDTRYQTALAIVLKKFLTSYAAAPDDATRSGIAEETLNTLLSMRVPAGEKDLHLELAISLQKIKQGLSANPQDAADGFVEMQTIISQTTWLHL